MTRVGVMLATISTIGSLIAAFVTYSTRVSAGDKPEWLVTWALANKSQVALLLLAVTGFIALADWTRLYLASRHQHKVVLKKILNDFSKEHFGTNARRNRLTLFIRTSGWRVWLWSLVKLPKFEKLHKWHALFRVKPRGEYLGVYLRPMDVRNRISCAAFRISDDPDECEGVAGLVWENGHLVLTNLPELERSKVREVQSLANLPEEHPVRQYAIATNVRDIRVLHACNHFARHFVGSLIRKSDGTPWGVLLLDSEDAECLFATDDGRREFHIKRFDDCARVIGKIIG